MKVRAIGVVENQAPTHALEHDLPVQDGLVQMDLEQDVCQIALVERHQGTGSVTNGFVSGFGFNVPCAIGSTVAHDSHHMIVVGTSKEDMAKAANRLGPGCRAALSFSKKGRKLPLLNCLLPG